MPSGYDVVTTVSANSRPSNDWDVSQTTSRVSIILWGMPRELTTLEVRSRLADLGLAR